RRERDEYETFFSLLSSPDPRTSVAKWEPRMLGARSFYRTARSAPGLVLGVEELSLERVTLLIVAVPLFPPLLKRHRKLEDARPFDLEDVEAHAVVHDRVALLRLAAEQPEDEAGHRVVVLGRHRRVE